MSILSIAGTPSGWSRKIGFLIAAFAASGMARPQVPVRELVEGERRPAEFHPSILAGVRTLAREHVRLAEIAVRSHGGDSDAESEVIRAVLAGIAPEDRRRVADAAMDAETAAQMLLSWKGWEGFEQVSADALRRARPIRCDDLLEVVWSDRLRELPSAEEEPELAAVAKKIEAIAGRPLPLRAWWPSVGYLLFGALHTPSFWPVEEDARERARAGR